MQCFRISGTAKLSGSVAVSGSKNAALPMMAAAILASQPVLLRGVPRLTDVDTLALVLGHLGVDVLREPDGTLRIETVDSTPTRADYLLVRQMRASFCVLGPLLARRGRAVVSLPGGCNIGARPVDLHLAGLERLGAEIRVEHGYVMAKAKRLVGAKVPMRGPRGSTVTGTANVLTAATLAKGETTITGAAIEPEIVDLGNFLNRLGANIFGLGTDVITVVGVDQLGGATHRVIADRVEAATLLIAAAITGGFATITGAEAQHLTATLDVLSSAGVDIDVQGSSISAAAEDRPRSVNFSARPFPGVPSDVQAQLMALLTLVEGRSAIEDCVFPERFMHVAELNRLGARIERLAGRAIVHGVERLSGADVTACDLRASAALVLAGLAAEGETTVHRIHHLDRGYERLEDKLNHLGARITRLNDPDQAVLPRAMYDV